MKDFRGYLEIERGDRFFEILEYILIFVDVYRLGLAASKEKLVPPHQPNLFIPMGCCEFPLRIGLPTAAPFIYAENGVPIDRFTLAFKDGPPHDRSLGTHGPGVGVFDMIFNSALLLLYERHAGWIGDTYKRGVKNIDEWPPTFRFMWALRNAAAHNRGVIKMDSERPPVTWHHLSFDHQDTKANRKILGDVLRAGDITLLLLEFSRELDNLGAPL